MMIIHPWVAQVCLSIDRGFSEALMMIHMIPGQDRKGMNNNELIPRAKHIGMGEVIEMARPLSMMVVTRYY